MSEPSTKDVGTPRVQANKNAETDAFILAIVADVVEHFSGDTAAYFANLSRSRPKQEKCEPQEFATRGFLKTLGA
jgi:hypothetical protein